jgi:hypothetical protein
LCVGHRWAVAWYSRPDSCETTADRTISSVP